MQDRGGGSGSGKPFAPTLLIILLLVVVIGLGAVSHYTSTAYLKTKFTSDNPKMRRWAVAQVVKKGVSAGPEMLKMAGDRTLSVESRRIAVFVLGEIGYMEGKKELITVFKTDELVLRGQAAFALGRMGDESVLPELISAYDSAPKGLKLKIISALGELGHPGGMELVARALEDSDELIRQTAEYALIKIKEKNGR